MRRVFIVFALLAIASCSDEPTATLNLVTGDELDTFTRDPKPATLVVEEISTDTTSRELSRTTFPITSDLGLGDVSKSDIAAIRVTALDASGNAIVKGESLFFQFGALDDSSSLDLFVQRTGELARLPNSPPTALDTPMLDVVLGRYIVAASGTATILYDLLLLDPVDSPPTLTRNAKSLATYGSFVISIDETGASSFDLSDGTTADLPLPDGGNFGEVAGGQTYYADDGTAYVVGATRLAGTAGKTARVLKIATDGTLTFAALATAREGASAAWVEGRGLIVFGGDAIGAGLEVLSATGTSAASLPFAPDATTNSGATALDGTHVLVVGGVGAPGDVGQGPPARVFDLGCSATCQPLAWPGGVPLVRAQAIGLAADAAIVVGDDATGNSRSFRVSAAATAEVMIKSARKGARMVGIPTGLVAAAVVGGATQIEEYRE